MTGLPSLLGALGLVALLFALAELLVRAAGDSDRTRLDPRESRGRDRSRSARAAAMNVDGLRERIHSGEAKRASKLRLDRDLRHAAVDRNPRECWVSWPSATTCAGTGASRRSTPCPTRREKVLAWPRTRCRGGGIVPAASRPSPIRDLLDRYEYVSDRFRVVEFADPNARPDLLQKYADHARAARQRGAAHFSRRRVDARGLGGG